tara:strand:- start:171 stop:338 length:168 start_codon:yes stop_codon:yes gene_type:complete
MMNEYERVSVHIYDIYRERGKGGERERENAAEKMSQRKAKKEGFCHCMHKFSTQL